MKRQRLVFSVILTLFASACGVIWSRSTATALERDLALLFGPPGLSDSEPNCAVIDTTRSGFCVYEGSDLELVSITTRLGLHPVTLQSDGTGASVVPPSDVLAGCLSQAGFENPRRLVAYESERRGDAIRLEDGTAFEYVLTLFEPVSGAICVLASYAYG